MDSSYIVTVEETECGNLILQFPEEMIRELGWDTGDTLVFSVNNDGTVYLSNTSKQSVTKDKQ